MGFGSSGVGTSNHVPGELFRLRTGVELTHVPYRGGAPALSDLIAANVQLAFMNLPTVLPPAEVGRERILGVCAAERVALRPDIPTVQGQGVPDCAVRSWTGPCAPRGTPEAAIRRVEARSRDALAQPNVPGRLPETDSEPIFMDAATTDRFVRDEYALWAPIARQAGVRIE